MLFRIAMQSALRAASVRPARALPQVPAIAAPLMGQRAVPEVSICHGPDHRRLGGAVAASRRPAVSSVRPRASGSARTVRGTRLLAGARSPGRAGRGAGRRPSTGGTMVRRAARSTCVRERPRACANDGAEDISGGPGDDTLDGLGAVGPTTSRTSRGTTSSTPVPAMTGFPRRRER